MRGRGKLTAAAAARQAVGQTKGEQVPRSLCARSYCSSFCSDCCCCSGCLPTSHCRWPRTHPPRPGPQPVNLAVYGPRDLLVVILRSVLRWPTSNNAMLLDGDTHTHTASAWLGPACRTAVPHASEIPRRSFAPSRCCLPARRPFAAATTPHPMLLPPRPRPQRRISPLSPHRP